MTASNVHRLDRVAPSAGAAGARWIVDEVIDAGDDGRLRLRASGPARAAASCLLAPMPGDSVLVALVDAGERPDHASSPEAPDGARAAASAGASAGATAFVALVLTRAEPDTAELRVEGARHVALTQDTITVTAARELRLQSVRDMAITSAGGTLRMSAHHLFVTATESLVESVRHHVAQVGSYALQVRDLLRMSAGHALVSAREDLKMDAERIDLG